jgi:hypothetical protein
MTIKSELDRLRLSYIAFRYDVVTGMFEGYDGTSWKHLDKVRYNAGNFEGWNGSAWVVIADTSEATSRIAADCTLQANINIEITNRTVADSSLQAALLVETTARDVADSSLQASLLTEVTNRTVADSSLQAALLVETTSRDVADSSLQAAILTEATSRATADSSLQAALLVETTARDVADSSLQAALLTEVTNRTVADSSLQANILVETTARDVADSSLQASLLTEVTNRTVADSSLQAAILTEATSRTVADSSLQAAILSEVTNRTVADSSLQANINIEITARTAADSLLQYNISVEDTLNPNPEETFIYYTRSDFRIDQFKFLGSTTGTQGVGVITFTTGQNLISGNLLGSVFLADNPVVNTAQVRLLYNVGKVDTLLGSYSFTVASANFSAGAVYSHNGTNYTVLNTAFGGTNLIATGAVAPLSSGTLTFVSGSGDASITFSAVVSNIAVSTDGGTSWNFPYQVYSSGLFVVADFTLPSGTTSTNFKIKVSAVAVSSELAGFGVNLVQDSTGSYAGDATKEIRVITSTEASTGLITLNQVRFTPGAGQLHCNYNGHDFITPDFIELGGGQVQFPLAFFTTGDTAKFYVGYGLVNTSNAPMTINNMLSSNSTLGSAVIPTGYTLDKPWMEIPAGAVITGAGNIETTGYITGAGILATTGSVVSTAKAPTQPKFDRIEEATAGKSVGFPNGLKFGGGLILSSYYAGSWVPTVVAQTGTITAYTLSYAEYIVVGRLVYVFVRVWITNKGTGTNDLRISNPPGLPPSVSVPLAGIEDQASGISLAGQVTILGYIAVHKADATTAIVDNYGIAISGVYPIA